MTFRKRPSGNRFANTCAFTLVEVMIASVILTITSVGILSGLLQARRMTEGSIHVATATTIAQGYIEQLKNMEFGLLDEPTISELNSQGEDDQLVASPLPTDPTVGNASTDIVNTRGIDINNTPENPQDDLELNFVLYIDNITDEANGLSEARRIILRWYYTDRTSRGGNEIGNTLFTVRSQVPTF